MSNNSDAPLCATGCGFYGNPAQQNLCSKCYRDYLKKTVVEQEQEQPRTRPCTTKNRDNVGVENGSGSEQTRTMKEKKRSRCGHESCNKRVGLVGFECKCGEVYCGSHRHPETHSCSFDFKGLQLESLSKTLYADADCKADKLEYRF